MPPVFWYYCVAGIGLALIIFTLFKKKNILNLSTYLLSAAAVAYLLEVIALFVLSSYNYKPGLYSNPIQENIFGHLLCNGLFWGGFTILAAAFQLRFYWVLLISGFFMLVEVVFLNLGIYTHNWWRTYMTGAGAFVFILLAKKWYADLKLRPSNFLRGFTFYFIAWLLLLAPSVILSLSDYQHFGIGLVSNVYRDDILFEAPYHLILSFVFVLFINILKKPNWKIATFIFIVLSDILMVCLNVLTFMNGWNLFDLVLIRFLSVALYIMFEKHSWVAHARDEIE